MIPTRLVNLIKLAFKGSLPLSLILIAIAFPANTQQVEDSAVTLSQSLSQAKSSNLLGQGKQYYQEGRYTEAVQIWQQALQTYQNSGNQLQQAQTLNYLSLGYQQLGQWQEAESSIVKSLAIIPDSGKLDKTSLLLRGQALNNQGQLQLSQGKTENSLQTWQQATNTYRRAGDETGELITSLNQAQALQAMGKYRQTKSLLEELVAQLREKPDSLLKAQGLRSLGVAVQTVGDLKQSKEILEESLAISQQLNSPQDITNAYFSIGNVAQDLELHDVAWTYYQEVVKLSPDKLTQVQAQLNQLTLLIDLQRWQPAEELMPNIETTLSELPASRKSIYARVNLAEKLMSALTDANQAETALSYDVHKIAQSLGTAIQQAREIKDYRAQAYALNQLGKLYQQQGQNREAQQLTEQSLQLAQLINADDIVARSSAQLGAIRQQQSNIKGAIDAYEIAFNKIQALRSDLVAINPDVQFDFKTGIESTYREYVNVLLKQDSQENLQKARRVMEALQIAELDNFFRDACLDSFPVVIDEIDVEAAVIYPIILSDRLEVILSLPGKPLRHYSTPLTSAQVEDTVKKYYSSLSPGYPREEGLQVAQQIYDWLIKPAETELLNNKSTTLVFVPDGFFRSVPMGALYDGKQYLIEKYGLAISPGLQLFPEGLKGKQASVLAVGMTEARQGFTSLPKVATEIEQIVATLDSQVLLNQEFTEETLSKTLEQKPFPIVHLATHGQFSSNPDEIFLLTWGDRISIQDFDALFAQRKLGLIEPIELLVMSACQTAAGDDRAALGLAGFALRSGARSTLASLWSVSDEATSELMGEFYTQLSSGQVSKAEALRQAQLEILSNPLYKHPYFWSAFVLVGNWL